MTVEHLTMSLIHNGELLESPAQLVRKRLEHLGLVNDVEEVCEQQPLVDNFSVSELGAWRTSQRRLEARWRKYVGSDGTMRSLMALGSEFLYSVHLHLSRSFAKENWRVREIESRVSRKHQEAWQLLADQSSPGMIILESDAVWLGQLSESICTISEFDYSLPLYVNLAGGLSLASIQVESLIERVIPPWVEFRQPVTNTSCAYVMSRPLAQLALSIIDEEPEVKELGVDWLLNYVFLNTRSRGVQVRCLHALPPILGHGSCLGVTESWHPDR